MKAFILFYFALVSVMAIFTLPQDKGLQESIERGTGLYKKKCAVCHHKNGIGKGKNFPPLAGSDFLLNNREASIKGVKYGFKEPLTVNGKTYKKEMKAVKLSNMEIADILNFALNSWGNQDGTIITEDEVANIPN